MANFETAVRSKFRFETNRGLVSTEDLWDMRLSSRDGFNLDEIAKSLHKELKDQSDMVSFVSPALASNVLLQEKFEIVKHVIDVKLAERNAAEEAAKKSAKKQKLLEIIARKQDQELEGASVEDLQRMVNDL